MVKNTVFKIASVGYIFIIFTFFLDEYVFSLINSIRFIQLTSIMYFVTDFGVIFIFGVIGVVSLLQKKYRFILFMTLSVLVALEASFLLKLIFQVPRPYALAYGQPLLLASCYAFPSIHTAVLCSLLPFQKYIFGKKSLLLVYFFMILIVFSRIYLGVHSLSDIIAGIVVGLVTTYGILNLEKKYKLLEWLDLKLTDKFELRRQTAHLGIGTLIVLLLKLQLMNSRILFFITFIGGILVLVARKMRVPLVHELLEYFERPHHMARFPGRGSFFLVLGAALATLIFEKNIAMASIMIMAVGDSVTNIVGRHFGKIKNPFNQKKNIEGTIVSILASTLAALFFVPLWPAFIASAIAMAIESIDIGIKRFEMELDDNVVIPLVAGALMTIML